MTQPLRPRCRYCGGPIRPRTIRILFGSGMNSSSVNGFWVERTARPKTKAEAQRHTNHPITQVRYVGQGEDRYIASASAWDGKSYADRFFCNGSHAQLFGHVMAEAGHATQTYAAAIAKDKAPR